MNGTAAYWRIVKPTNAATSEATRNGIDTRSRDTARTASAHARTDSVNAGTSVM